jgi:glycosyltransferase involved in cell wall biosynthesis
LILNSTPKVSVIIPAYNAMKFLPETLESVLNQTFSDFDVFIINDGSSDNIIEWATEIQDSRVKLISQENKGLAGARNTGITKSQGQYIAFIDADDLWEPTKLERQVHAFELNPELGLVDTYVSMVDTQNQFLYIAGASYQEGNVLRRAIEENLVMCGSSAMINRQCFEKVGFFDQTLRGAEDWNMWARIALHYPFKVVEEPLVRYRNHPNSMSQDWQLMKTETTKAIEKVFELVPPELAWVKQRTFARANLYVAKIAKSGGNYQQSLQYCLQAFSCSPPICLNIDYLRLIVKNLLRVA